MLKLSVAILLVIFIVNEVSSQDGYFRRGSRLSRRRFDDDHHDRRFRVGGFDSHSSRLLGSGHRTRFLGSQSYVDPHISRPLHGVRSFSRSFIGGDRGHFPRTSSLGLSHRRRFGTHRSSSFGLSDPFGRETYISSRSGFDPHRQTIVSTRRTNRFSPIRRTSSLGFPVGY